MSLRCPPAFQSLLLLFFLSDRKADLRRSFLLQTRDGFVCFGPCDFHVESPVISICRRFCVSRSPISFSTIRTWKRENGQAWANGPTLKLLSGSLWSRLHGR